MGRRWADGLRSLAPASCSAGRGGHRHRQRARAASATFDHMRHIRTRDSYRPELYLTRWPCREAAILRDVPAAQAKPGPIAAAFAKDVQAPEADGLDGWLLYDFRGSNPIAADITAVSRQGGHLATRRWYLPDSGRRRAARPRPRASNRTRSTHLPGSTTNAMPAAISSEAGLRACSAASVALAMEYSPGCAIPARLARRRRHRSSWFARLGRRRRVVRRSDPALFGGLERGRRRDAPASVRSLYRVKDRALRSDRATAARRHRDDRNTTSSS